MARPSGILSYRHDEEQPVGGIQLIKIGSDACAELPRNSIIINQLRNGCLILRPSTKQKAKACLPSNVLLPSKGFSPSWPRLPSTKTQYYPASENCDFITSNHYTMPFVLERSRPYIYIEVLKTVFGDRNDTAISGRVMAELSIILV